jgi:hypothetical protein
MRMNQAGAQKTVPMPLPNCPDLMTPDLRNERRGPCHRDGMSMRLVSSRPGAILVLPWPATR